jgi:ornithine carbamoyltransferase
MFQKSTMPKHFISVTDFSSDEIKKVLDIAGDMKKNPNKYTSSLKDKTLVMLFEKKSTRTRLSFEVGMTQLGGHAIFLDSSTSQLGRGETIADTARVISRYADIVMARVFKHSSIKEMAENSSIPVINGLSDYAHPCQALGDVLTIKEHKGLNGLKVVYLGDGNNVCNSLALACNALGLTLTVGCPEGYDPDSEIVKKTGTVVVRDPIEAVKDADVIYTDVWVSMGDEVEKEKRLNDLSKYQVNQKIVSAAKSDCIVMHCLPAHRGQEITDEIMDGEHSAVFDQAENRLHIQKAIMYVLGEDKI